MPSCYHPQLLPYKETDKLYSLYKVKFPNAPSVECTHMYTHTLTHTHTDTYLLSKQPSFPAM